MLRKVVMISVTCVLAACTSPAASPTETVRSRSASDALATSPPAAGVSSDARTIVKVRLRDVDLTIQSSPGGPRFVVSAIDGAVLERDLEDGELAARYPDLYRLYRSAMVRTGSYLDARLDSTRDIEPLSQRAHR